jgi:hypothetical protein
VVSPDGCRIAVTVSGFGAFSYSLELWQLYWDYAFPEPASWDEGAEPTLAAFLAKHPPQGRGLLRRPAAGDWTEDDFQQLLTELAYRGFGWVRPEGVRHRLEEMAREVRGR